jgi:hypothetical protein
MVVVSMQIGVLDGSLRAHETVRKSGLPVDVFLLVQLCPLY